MFGTGFRLAGRRAARFGLLQRSIVTASRSVLDLMTDPTPQARAIVDEAVLRPEHVPKIDILHSNLNKASRTDELLELVQRHGEVMKENHLVECWFVLNLVVTYGGDLESIKNSPGFDELSRITCQRLHLFSPERLVNLCSQANRFQLPVDSDLYSSILQSLKNVLRDMSLMQLMRAQHSLKEVSGESKHLDIIRLSLPVIFQAKVREELDTGDGPWCRRALLFALNESMDAETCELIGSSVLPFVKDFTVFQAFQVLKAIADNETLAHRAGSVRQILSSCVDKVARSPSELLEDQIEIVLECCNKHRVSSRALFEAFWSQASGWPFDMKVSLLKASLNGNYLSLPAAEFATELIVSNEHQVTEAIDILKLAEAVAMVALRHEPISEKFQQALSAGHIIANAHARIDSMLVQRPHLLAEFSLCLAAVGLFPEERLRLLFDEDFQRSLCQKETGYNLMVELEQCADLYLGESNPYKVIREIKALAERDAEQSYIPMSLSETLRVALGGEQFVATRVKTPLGTRADYIIVMRKGEYAMAFPDGASDPLGKIPPDSKVVAILIEKDENDAFGHTELNELRKRLRERNLRMQNIGTLTINAEKFEKLPLRNRTPFVMKSFKEVLRDCPVFNSDRTGFSFKW